MWYRDINKSQVGVDMNNFFQKASKKLNDMLNDEAQIVTKIKEKLKDKGIPVLITSDMLMYLLKKQIDQNDKVYNLNITFKEDFIRFSGVTKKLLIEIPFELDLKPLRSEGRVLYFDVKNMKPLNHDWIKSKVLNKPPLLVYTNESTKLDLNQVEKMQEIPIGNIQHFEIKEGKLWIKLGL